MLNETLRAIKPEQIGPLVKWDKCEAVVILCKGKVGEPNHLVMSTLTVEELCFLKTQLDVYINEILAGGLVEALPGEGKRAANAADIKDDAVPQATDSSSRSNVKTFKKPKPKKK